MSFFLKTNSLFIHFKSKKVFVEKIIKGEAVPAIGLGTYSLTGHECIMGIEDALSIGYRHIDTAQAYGNEAEIGEAIKNSEIPRREIFLTTKVWPSDLKAEQVYKTVDHSLSDLQTDYVDLLLIHWPNSAIPLEETLGAFENIRKAGKTRHIGVSNFSSKLFKKATEISEIFCNQCEYHPYLDQSELIELSEANESLFTAYSPLAKGKVIHDDILLNIGKKYDKLPAQVVLRWLIQQANVAAIPRSSKHEHRIANFNIFEFELNEEEMRIISNISKAK